MCKINIKEDITMYEQKLIHKFIYYICILTNHKIPKEKIIQIANDEIKCLTEEEFYLKRLVNTFNHLMNNVNQTLNGDIVNQLYFLLTNQLLDEKILKELVCVYYENYDNSAHYIASILHLFIIHNIKQESIEFAFLISNYVMVKKNKGILIPYEYVHLYYQRAIDTNQLSDLIRVFFDIEYVKDNSLPCQYSRNEIIEMIKSIKDELMNTYGVKRLYLFGSYAKGTNHQNSDVDFLVILNEELLNTERLEKIESLKDDLKKRLACGIDILDFTFALDTLGENEMEHIITLI